MYGAVTHRPATRRPWHEIVAILESRRQQDSPLKRAMVEVRDRVNGDGMVIPLVDVEGEPAIKSPSPQLIADAIDATASRAGSTRPTASFPAVDPSALVGRGGQSYANTRRRSTYAVWHRSAFPLLTRRAYRHLAGYGEMAMWVMPDMRLDMPRIELRDPLTAYPEPRSPEDVRPPIDVGFIHGRSSSWLLSQFPDNADLKAIIGAAHSRQTREASLLWDVAEWIDENEIVLGIIGPRQVGFTLPGGAVRPIEIKRWPNLAGLVPCAVGQRVTLDRVASQVSSVVGTVDLMDKLLALDVIAQEKAIFPDRYLVSEVDRPPRILNTSGHWEDGRTGEMNLLENVRSIGEIRSDTSPMTQQLIATLERNARISSGNPSMFGGELTGAIRSGQTVNALGSFSVDPRVQEAQEIMAYQLTVVNEAIGATFKGYFGGRKLTLFSGWPSDKGKVDVEPDKHWECLDNVVQYSFPGADVNGLTVAVGQLVGSRMMSKQTGRRMHPFIDDESHEDQQVAYEAIVDAGLQGFLTQVSDGTLPLADWARVAELMSEGNAFPVAVSQAQREAQERQAREAPAPDPGMAAPPETQPGLSMPGMGVEQQPGPPGGIPGPVRSLENFRQISRAMTGPAGRPRRQGGPV